MLGGPALSAAGLRSAAGGLRLVTGADQRGTMATTWRACLTMALPRKARLSCMETQSTRKATWAALLANSSRVDGATLVHSALPAVPTYCAYVFLARRALLIRGCALLAPDLLAAFRACIVFETWGALASCCAGRTYETSPLNSIFAVQ